MQFLGSVLYWSIEAVVSVVIVGVPALFWITFLNWIFGFDHEEKKNRKTIQDLESSNAYYIEKYDRYRKQIQNLQKEHTILKQNSLPEGMKKTEVVQNKRKVSILKKENHKLKDNLEHMKRIVEFQKDLLKQKDQEIKNQDIKSTKGLIHHSYKMLLDGLSQSEYLNDLQIYSDILSSSD